MNKRNSTTVRGLRSARVAAALPEAMANAGVSDSEVAKLSGVSRPTVARIRAGRAVRPELLVKVATVVLVLEWHIPPAASKVGLRVSVMSVYDEDMGIGPARWRGEKPGDVHRGGRREGHPTRGDEVQRRQDRLRVPLRDGRRPHRVGGMERLRKASVCRAPARGRGPDAGHLRRARRCGRESSDGDPALPSRGHRSRRRGGGDR